MISPVSERVTKLQPMFWSKSGRSCDQSRNISHHTCALSKRASDLCSGFLMLYLAFYVFFVCSTMLLCEIEIYLVHRQAFLSRAFEMTAPNKCRVSSCVSLYSREVATTHVREKVLEFFQDARRFGVVRATSRWAFLSRQCKRPPKVETQSEGAESKKTQADNN